MADLELPSFFGNAGDTAARHHLMNDVTYLLHLVSWEGTRPLKSAKPCVTQAPLEDISTTAILLAEYPHGFSHALWPVASRVSAQRTAVVISLVRCVLHDRLSGKGSTGYVRKMQPGYRANPNER